MKRIIIFFIVVLGLNSIKANEAYKVTYSQSNSNEIVLEFNLGNFSLNQTILDNKQYTRIAFNHSIATNKKGYAELPYIHASVELLNNDNVSLEVEKGDYIDYQLETDLVPSRGTIYRNHNSKAVPYVIDPLSIKDNWYPRLLAKSTEPYIIKDKRGINIFAYPFVYNADKKILRVYKSLKVKLVKNSSVSVNPIIYKTTKVLPEMQSVYKSLFINHKEKSRDNLTINQYGDILLITTSRDESAVDPYIKWKREKGFMVEKEVVATGTNVKSLIKEKYEANNNILYVVLVGDWDDIKSDNGPQNGPMDPQLGCVVGTDNVADIIVGRISANQASDVTVQVNKFINYEKNPEVGADWYSATLGIGSAEGGPSEGKGDDMEADTAHQRVIYEDKLSTFTYKKFYKAFDPGASINDVKTAIESGVSIINYSGHGSETSWGTSVFSNSNVNNLTNENKLPFIVSVACNNGDFHKGTCFAESWLRKENGGAVVMLAASISQPWDEPMRGQDYISDLIIGGYNYDDHKGQNGISTTEQRSIIGSIVFNAFVLMTSESDGISDWETVKTWNIFGDPTIQLRTETPHQLVLTSNKIISHVPFETIVKSDGNPIKGAQVCISKDDIYYSGITDAEGRVSIEHTLTPGPCKLVVTSFNSTTKYEDIDIIRPEGVYVVTADYTINDKAENNNELFDFDETVLLNVNAKNVGSEHASDVIAKLSSIDLHVTINDDSYEFGRMVSNTTIIGIDAFSISLADDVQDQHMIEFDVEFTDSTSKKWNSSIFIVANAPEFAISEITVDDAKDGNNDGVFDAGETVDLNIQVTNTGHAKSILGRAEILTSSTNFVINSSSQEVIELSPEQTQILSYSVTANEDVDLEALATINCEIISGKYISSKDLDILIGKFPEYLIKNGTFEVSTGRFMDTGGEYNEYKTNENKIITFKPKVIGDTIELDFESFNIEQDFDFMYIYDGLDDEAIQIGNPFTGLNSPGKIKANNSDGALTVKFTSDEYVNASGWAAIINTIAGPVVDTTDVRNLEKVNVFILYPNPARSEINIETIVDSQVEIYNLAGTMVCTSKLNIGLNTINSSELKPGTYLIRYVNDDRSVVRKLIIQK